MDSLADPHNYDTRTKITGELQVLLDYGKIIKLFPFLNRNQLKQQDFAIASKLSV